jgi:hypothetical protein
VTLANSESGPSIARTTDEPLGSRSQRVPSGNDTVDTWRRPNRSREAIGCPFDSRAHLLENHGLTISADP